MAKKPKKKPAKGLRAARTGRPAARTRRIRKKK